MTVTVSDLEARHARFGYHWRYLRLGPASLDDVDDLFAHLAEHRATPG